MDAWIPVILALLAFLTALVTATVTIVSKLGEVRTQVDGVHQQINSRMDQLVRTTEALAHAQGVNAGVEQEKAKAALILEGASKPVPPVVSPAPDPPPRSTS